MKILLAGGTGVLGRKTVPLLVEAGHEVVAVSRREEADEALRRAGAEPFRLDVFDGEAAARAAEGVDAVVNLATRIPLPPRALLRRAWRANDRLRREASRNLAEGALRAGARFVQESFAPTYPDRGSRWITEEEPLAPMRQTATVADAEASADRVVEGGGVGVVLRFGLFYGSHARDWVDAAARGRLMLPGPGERYASMVHVADAAAAVVASLELPAGRYNVVEDEPLTRHQHAAVLEELVGRGRRVKPLPAWLGRLPQLRVLARSHRVSNRKLRESSGWRPRAPSVREGWRLALEETGEPAARG